MHYAWGVLAYQEDLADGEFLDLGRVVTGPPAAPAMDVSYLVDGVMVGNQLLAR
jgi:hypothetical protein